MSEYMNEKFDYIINKTDEMIDELIDYFIKDKALLKEYLRKQSKEKEELEQRCSKYHDLIEKRTMEKLNIEQRNKELFDLLMSLWNISVIPEKYMDKGNYIQGKIANYMEII